MNDFPGHFSDCDLKKQRDEVRRGLLRVNSAAVVILVVVIGLATAAILTAFQASRNAAAEEAAHKRAEEELWKSRLSQARAGRLSELPGRRGQGLEAVAAAARIRPDVE